MVDSDYVVRVVSSGATEEQQERKLNEMEKNSIKINTVIANGLERPIVFR